MFKGTTPTHTFNVSIDTSLIKEVKITYSQKDKDVLIKRTKDCTIDEGTISIRLSQEDTFLFEGNTMVMIQLRVLTSGGDALVAEPVMMTVGKCHDDEVIT